MDTQVFGLPIPLISHKTLPTSSQVIVKIVVQSTMVVFTQVLLLQVAMSMEKGNIPNYTYTTRTKLVHYLKMA